MMAPALALPATISAFEQRFRSDHAHEHALLLDCSDQVVVARTGDVDSVDFAPYELMRATGGMITHTHPRALPVSGTDLALAAAYGLTLRAVGVAPDTEQRFDHTVWFALPSPMLAKQLPAAFDDAVEQAERELVHQPYGDLQWQREARHLAVGRLAEWFGFSYQRSEIGASLSEATRHERARLDVLAGVDNTIRQQVFAPLVAVLIRDLLRLSSDGTVPVSAIERVRQIASAHVQRAMLGSPLMDGSLAPYTVEHGEPRPRSLYFRVLYGLLRSAATTAVKRHADIMRKYLPADIIRSLEYAALNPFETTLSEAEGPQYDPLHLWLGSDGKRLSDRIWQAAGDMRAKLDAYLTQAIARRLPVEQMAHELEQFLVKGKGGYEALRLARNETASAGHRADWLAAQGNPLVEAYSPFVAPTHTCCDRCDTEQKNGPYPASDPSHLPIFHVNCLCGVIWHVVEGVKAVIIRLRQKIDQAAAAAKRAFTDYIGPISRHFVGLLFRGRGQ